MRRRKHQAYAIGTVLTLIEVQRMYRTTDLATLALKGWQPIISETAGLVGFRKVGNGAL